MFYNIDLAFKNGVQKNGQQKGTVWNDAIFLLFMNMSMFSLLLMPGIIHLDYYHPMVVLFWFGIDTTNYIENCGTLEVP